MADMLVSVNKHQNLIQYASKRDAKHEVVECLFVGRGL